MPSQQEYAAAAPYVMAIGGFSAAAIETKLAAIPKPPAYVPPKEPTKTAIVTLFDDLYAGFTSVTAAIEARGGLLALARKHCMTVAQVSTCIADFEAMRTLYAKPPTV